MERRKRRWWTRGITWLSIIAISGALISALFQLAVALAPGYRADVAREASTLLGQPVEVDALALRWRWLWPLLELKGVRLLATEAGAAIVDVERIRLGFDLAELLRGELTPAEVEIEGVQLATEITAEGRWRLRGRAESREPLSFEEVARVLKRFSRLRAERVTLEVDDLRPGAKRFAATLQRADLRQNEQGFELRAELQAPELIASRLRLRAGMTGDLATPALWQGRWTLDASGIAPAEPLQRLLPALQRVQWGDATVTASGDWQRGAPGASELALRAQSLALAGDASSVLKDVDVGLHYRPSDTGGTLDVVPLRLVGRKGLWPTTTARLDWRRAPAAPAAPAAAAAALPSAEGAAPSTEAAVAVTTASDPAPLHWRASSDFLRLDDLGPWSAALLPALDTRERAVLTSLRGDLAALDGRWQPQAAGAARYSLYTRFTDLAARVPGEGSVQGVAGEITADEQSGRATVTAAPLRFELPRAFAGPQQASRFEADAQWRRDGAGWKLTVPRLEWALLGSEGRATAELQLAAAAAPVVKLEARFDVADLAALKPLMPVHWGQPLKDWLQRALVRGRVAKAVLAIDGPLDDFPFVKRPTGRWSLLLPISATRLEYHREWPGIDQLAATIRFAGNGLSFETQRGLISGVAVTTARGGIENFNTSPLVLDGKTVGEAPFYYGLLRASPLAARLQALLARSEMEGPTEADVHLEIPLHSGEGQKTVARGDVRLLGNTLRHDALDRPVRDITGSLSFGSALAGEGLRGRFYETPVTARIGLNAEGSDQLEVAVRVDYQTPDGIAARYVPGWLRAQLAGESDWRVEVPLGGKRAGRVRLTSTLAGTTSQLPAPAAKRAEELMPIALELTGDEATPLAVTGEVDGHLGLALRFARANAASVPEVRSVNLRLGAGPPAVLLVSDGWHVGGQLQRLDPDQWQPLLAALREGDPRGGDRSGESRLPFLGAELSVQQLTLAGFDLPPMSFNARREYGGYTLAIKGAATAGNLKLSSAGDALSGRFSSLQLTPAPKSPAAASAEPTAGEPIDPTRAPTVDLTIDALTIGGRPFGALALATERSARGQRITRFTLDGGIASFKGDGEWRRSEGMTEAQSRFTVTSDDLAGTLEGLGFAATVSGRNARIVGDLTWPAARRGFEWAQGRGTVSLAVENGSLRTVDPGGSGRVLGLFNFYALPRRLTLDFGDVVSKGLGFDRIEGAFKLADGVATTNDLTVRGPSVRVEVRGDIGLAAKDYNQVITVTPNTKGITLGALMLGGAASVAVPVLPVIAVIANQVIDKPLGQVTQLTYGLTGSWENPEIKKLAQSAESEPTRDGESPKP